MIKITSKQELHLNRFTTAVKQKKLMTSNMNKLNKLKGEPTMITIDKHILAFFNSHIKPFTTEAIQDNMYKLETKTLLHNEIDATYLNDTIKLAPGCTISFFVNEELSLPDHGTYEFVSLHSWLQVESIGKRDGKMMFTLSNVSDTYSNLEIRKQYIALKLPVPSICVNNNGDSYSPMVTAINDIKCHMLSRTIKRSKAIEILNTAYGVITRSERSLKCHGTLIIDNSEFIQIQRAITEIERVKDICVNEERDFLDEERTTAVHVGGRVLIGLFKIIDKIIY